MTRDLAILLGMVAVVLISGCIAGTEQAGESEAGDGSQGSGQEPGPSGAACEGAGFSVENMSFEENVLVVRILNTGRLDLAFRARVDYLDGEYESWDSIGAVKAGEEKHLAVVGVSRNVESVSLNPVECPGVSETVMSGDIHNLPELYEGDVPEGGEAIEQEIDYEDYECMGSIPCIFGAVDRVIDGDTLYIGGYLIRLALVDTPESGEPGFEEANRFTEALCAPGSLAVFDIDDRQKEDRYGRFLAVVYCSGENLNEQLLRKGHGELMEHYCSRSEFGSEKWAEKYGC